MKMFAGCLRVGLFNLVLSCLAVTTLAREPLTTGKVKAGRLNVRARAGTSFEVIGTLRAGKEVEIFSKHKDWYEVAAPQNAEIWIASKYITNKGVVKGNKVKLRAGPGIVFSSYHTLSKGKQVVMTGKSRNGWVSIKVPNGITAWASADYIEPEDPSVFDKDDKERKKLTFAVDEEEEAIAEKLADSKDGDAEGEETVAEKEEDADDTDEKEGEQVAMGDDVDASSGDDDELTTDAVDETDEKDEEPQVADSDVPETTDEVDEQEQDNAVAAKTDEEAGDADKAVDDEEETEKVLASGDTDEQEKQSGDAEEVKPVAHEDQEGDAEDEEAVFTIPELANEQETVEDAEEPGKDEDKPEPKIAEMQPDTDVEETEAEIFLKFLEDRRKELRRREKAMTDVAQATKEAEMAKWIVEPEARGVLLSLKGRSNEFATHILVEIRNKVAYPICYLKSDYIELDEWRNRTVCVYGAERRYPGWKRPVIEVRGIQLNTTYAALDESSTESDR